MLCFTFYFAYTKTGLDALASSWHTHHVLLVDQHLLLQVRESRQVATAVRAALFHNTPPWYSGSLWWRRDCLASFSLPSPRVFRGRFIGIVFRLLLCSTATHSLAWSRQACGAPCHTIGQVGMVEPAAATRCLHANCHHTYQTL